jgi:hypothetical protein
VRSWTKAAALAASGQKAVCNGLPGLAVLRDLQALATTQRRITRAVKPDHFANRFGNEHELKRKRSSTAILGGSSEFRLLKWQSSIGSKNTKMQNLNLLKCWIFWD